MTYFALLQIGPIETCDFNKSTGKINLIRKGIFDNQVIEILIAELSDISLQKVEKHRAWRVALDLEYGPSIPMTLSFYYDKQIPMEMAKRIKSFLSIDTELDEEEVDDEDKPVIKPDEIKKIC